MNLNKLMHLSTILLVLLTICSLSAQDSGSVGSTNPDSVKIKIAVADTIVLDTTKTDTAATAGSLSGNISKQAGEITEHISFGKIVLVTILIAMNLLLVRFMSFVLKILADRFPSYRIGIMTLIPINRVVLWTLTIYVVISAVIDPSAQSLLAFLASAGVAIGFASQDILKNIFGGILVLMDRPFQVGDKIKIGEYYGEVVGIGLRSTRIQTPDDSLVSVPNGDIINTSISNANAGELNCQVVVDLYLPGNVDIQKAKQIAFEAAATSRYIYLSKPIVVNVVDDYKFRFLTHLKVKAYVHDIRNEFRLASDITEIAKTEFNRLGWFSGAEATPQIPNPVN